jgi:hypothetical protein
MVYTDWVGAFRAGLTLDGLVPDPRTRLLAWSG